jgi:signal transduction histidine kinase
MSFRRSLFLILVPFVLAATGLSAIISYYYERKLIHSYSTSLSQQALQRVNTRVSDLLEKSQDQLREQAYLTPNDITAKHFHPLFDAIAPTFSLNPQIAYIGFGLETTGEYALLLRQPDGTLKYREYLGLAGSDRRKVATYPMIEGKIDWTKSEVTQSRYDPRVRPPYLKAKRETHPIWTEFYPFWGEESVLSHVPGISYAIPLFREGKLIGVWDLDFDVYGLESYLQQVRAELPGGFPFIVEVRPDGETEIVAYPEGHALTSNGDRKQNPQHDAVMRSFAGAMPKEFASNEKTAESIEFTANEEDYYAAYYKFTGYERPHWVLITAVPKSALMAPLRKSTWWHTVLLTTLMLGAGAASYLLARHVARPINRLKHKAELVTQGLPSSQLLVHGPSEIEQLSQVFDTMASAVKVREETIRDSEQNFKRMFHASPTYLNITRLEDRRLVEVNEAWLNAMGIVSKDQVIGKTSTEVGLKIDHDFLMGIYEVLRKEGFIRDVVFAAELPGGRKIVGLGAATRIDWYGVPCVLWMYYDITDRYRAEVAIRELNSELEDRVAERTAQLELANKELESYSYSVSHDLRSPLRAIHGFSQALEEDYAPQLDDIARDYLHRIQNASLRMEELIDGLLNLSRVTSEPLNQRRVNLSYLAHRANETCRVNEPDRQVTTTIQPELMVYGDPNLLGSAIDNLFSNAWKYTRTIPQATIEFGMMSVEGEKRFFIRDNGVGFEMKYAGKLFMPFQRLHSAKEFEGHGIGLATVQRIIVRHGGRVWAESQTGQGCTLYFTLANHRSLPVEPDA